MTPYYQDNWVTIFNADCRGILPLLDPVELLLTDPPYGIGFAGQPTKWQRLAGNQPKDWDDKPVSRQILIDYIHIAGKSIIWGGNYFQLPISRCWLSWCKPDAPPSMGNVEVAWTNLEGNSKYIVHSISATNKERVSHPTQKPLRVIRWALNCADVGERAIICDPFMGSGTTLVAAKQLGRRAIGIEISKEYCDIAIERLRQDVLDFSEPLPEAQPVTGSLFDAGEVA